MGQKRRKKVSGTKRFVLLLTTLSYDCSNHQLNVIGLWTATEYIAMLNQIGFLRDVMWKLRKKCSQIRKKK